MSDEQTCLPAAQNSMRVENVRVYHSQSAGREAAMEKRPGEGKNCVLVRMAEALPDACFSRLCGRASKEAQASIRFHARTKLRPSCL